jgi:hypothetical protein
MASRQTEYVLVERNPHSGDEEELFVGTSPIEIDAQLDLLLEDD